MQKTVISEQPLLGQIGIYQIERRIVESKLSSIVIVKITTRSLLFVSQLKFPLSESVIYQLKTTIAENDIDLYGTIIKSISQTGSEARHYQFEFLMKQDQFIPLLSDNTIPRLYKNKKKYFTDEELNK